MDFKTWLYRQLDQYIFEYLADPSPLRLTPIKMVEEALAEEIANERNGRCAH